MPRKNPKKDVKLRVDVISASYVGVDVSIPVPFEIEENAAMKAEILRQAKKKVRVASTLHASGAVTGNLPYMRTACS